MTVNKYYCECYYCGNKWTKHYYLLSSSKPLRCGKCGDSRIKTRELKNIDYYNDKPDAAEMYEEGTDYAEISRQKVPKPDRD